MTVLNTSATGLALSKPPLLALLTNAGQSGAAAWSVPGAGYSAHQALTEVLSCAAVSADAQGGVSASTSSGQPMVRDLHCPRGVRRLTVAQVLLPSAALAGSGLCGGGSKPNGAGKSQGSGPAGPGVLVLALVLVVIVVG